MNCSGFEKYQLDEWTEAQFETHLKSCPECRQAEKQDEEVVGLARTLKNPVPAPGLWEKIEKDIKQDHGKILQATWWRHPVLRAAAVLILAAGLFVSIRWLMEPAASGILADSALRRVEAREDAYEEAIDELAQAAGTQLSEFDIGLSLLYRDRLETIDAQIEEVKTALETNPGNAHLRRYLFAALKDKKKTLQEILDHTPVPDPAIGG